MWNLTNDYFAIVLTTLAVLISAVEDLRRKKIPNMVTFPTMLLALCYHTMTSGIDGLLFSSGGLALGIGLFILPYAMGGMGAGDVKLMGALGAIFGAKGTLLLAILSSTAGAIYALILIALNPRYLKSLFVRLWTALSVFVFARRFIVEPADPKIDMPVVRYAVPIAMGAGCYVYMMVTGYDLFPELLGEKFQIFSIAMH